MPSSHAATDPSQALRATRRAAWLIALPVLLLLAVLGVNEVRVRTDAAARDLQRRADERAQSLESIARPAMHYVLDLKRLLEQRWNDPPDPGPALRSALRPRLRDDGRPDGWSLDEAGQTTRERFGQVWWAPPDGAPPQEAWLRRAAMFVEQARVVHAREPGFVGTWFAPGHVNTSFGYPWVATGSVLQSFGLPSLAALEAPRREGTERALRELARDPDDISFWGPPYASQLDGEAVVSHGAAVIVDGRYVGEVSIDFRLDALQKSADGWRRGGSRVWILDGKRRVLADSAEPVAQGATAGAANRRILAPLAERLPAALGIDSVEAALAEPGRARREGDWVVVAATRPGSPWIYVEAVPAAELGAAVLPGLAPHLLLALALLASVVAAQWWLARYVAQPSLEVLAYLRARSLDPGAPRPALGRRWQAWVDAVADTFARQDELQRRERLAAAFRAALIDNAPTAIVTADGQGRLVEFNPAAEQMFGRRRDEVLGHDVGEIVVPQRLRDAHRAELARLFAGETIDGFGRPLQSHGQRADGSEFPMQTLGCRVRVDGADFYTAFITDLSGERAAQRQIERQREALRQSEKLTAMGSLLASVAHELNNPLAIVMGRASLLEDKAAGTPVADDARRIREAADRCGRIVRTFLAMARQRPPQRSAVPLNDLVRAAAELLAYTLRSHAVELTMALADDLPPVQADADQLGQVVLNLLVNAQQALAGREGPRRVTVTTGLEARREGREPRVWLRVADNGPGVGEEMRERIFEPFVTSKTEGSGTGLGLSVSRAIVREHGGDLVLETASAGGASFRLSLPMSGGATAQPAPAA